MEEPLSFAPLLIVLLLAFAVPVVLARFKWFPLPIVVGEILAGMLVGRSGLGWVAHRDPLLELLSELGFVFLMFLSGMEVDFSMLRGGRAGRKGASPLALGGVNFLLTLGLSTLIGIGLTQAGLVSNPWMIALILSTTSLGVVVPVLKERGLIVSRYGQGVLMAALIADFATMLLITVVVAELSHGLTLDILLVGLLFVAFFLFAHFGNLFFNRIPAVRRMLAELSHATAQIKVRIAFTLMMIFVVLAEFLGTEIILGAFLAGVVVSLLSTPDDDETLQRLESFGYGFFIPIFFIMVGVDFNLQAVLSSPHALVLLPELLLAAVVVKMLPGLIFRLNHSWREAWGAGALLSARLSLIIAASAIGMRLGVISETLNSDIILVAIVTVTFAPMLFTRLVPGGTVEGRHLILVAGANVLGLQVAGQIRAHNDPVVILDDDPESVARARRRGFEAVCTTFETPDPSAEDYFKRANRLVCVYSDVEKSYQVCAFVRSHYSVEHIVARVTSPLEIQRFESLGVSPLNAMTDQAMLLTLLTRNPSLYALLTRTDDQYEVREVVVHNREMLNKPLASLDLPDDILITAIRRDGHLLIPHGDTRLEMGDLLTLMGPRVCVEKARYLVSGGRDRGEE